MRKKHDNNIKNNERRVKCAFNINMITLNAKTIKKINNNKALNTMWAFHTHLEPANSKIEFFFKVRVFSLFTFITDSSSFFLVFLNETNKISTTMRYIHNLHTYITSKTKKKLRVEKLDEERSSEVNCYITLESFVLLYYDLLHTFLFFSMYFCVVLSVYLLYISSNLNLIFFKVFLCAVCILV